jgi:PAS domain S-box-containing protein
MNRIDETALTHVVSHVFERVRQSVLIADEAGRIQYANQASETVFGYHPDEMVDLELSEVFTPEDLNYFYPNLMYLAGGGQTFEGEVMLLRRDGGRFYAYLVFSPHVESSGGPYRVVMLAQDIDQSKRIEKLIQETRFEDVVKIANGIAHEIRNPLVGIGGFANRLYQSCAPTPNQDRYHQFIMNNIGRIERIVHNINSLVALPRPRLDQVSTVDLVDRTLEPIRADLEQRGIGCEVNVEEVTLLADSNLCAQAVSILLHNAVDAVQQNGRVDVWSEVKNGLFHLYVRDTGPGIKAEDLPYLFIPFFSTKADGVGIDLAIVKRIMENHGGRVEAASEEGRGATFSLIFPLERRRALRVAPVYEKQPELR